MKKIRMLALGLCIILTLAACGARSDKSSANSGGTSTPAVSGDQDNNQTSAPSSEAGTPDMSASDEEGNDAPDETTGSRVLVAYFSCTSNTRGLAEKIASTLDADLYEIIPEQPYTDDDLNYNDSSTRATVEQNDPDARPAISGAVENMADYDIILLGYPIWWGQAPKIIYTFLESYDFSGKTIVPFCTSGSSGIGSSATNLHSIASAATWLDGQRFSGGSSRSTVETWINSLGLTLTPAA